jgi:Ras-related protein Rab-2A
MLVANKVDLPEKVITSEMGAEYARQNGMGFMEVSAKTDLNIAAAFRNLISSIYSAVN